MKWGHMKLTWFGTAGFRIENGEHTLLIDPYLTRNRRAFPKQALKPSDIPRADLILITHGHFDHIFDVPEIASKTNATVYCGRGVDQTLILRVCPYKLVRRIAGTPGFQLPYVLFLISAGKELS